MAVRNLYRQARPFRILGWGLFACALLNLPGADQSFVQRLAGLLLAGVGMGVLDALRYGLRPRGVISDRDVQMVQLLELLLVPMLLLVLELPLALFIAVLGALINANVALGGDRGLAIALVSTGFSGCLAAAWGAGWPIPTAKEQIWLAAALLLLMFTVGLARIGFRVTQKLDDHRRQWQERLAVLRPFVPPALADQSPVQQRRWVSVVMVDIVEFSRQSSPLAPEVITKVLDDLLDAIVARANDTGGTLDKFMGDGALLFFTRQPGRAQAAFAALRFARTLLTDLPRLNQRWQGFGAPQPLQLRVGIAAGYCSLGQWGTRDVRAFTLIGDCVGLAERLQTVSAANSVAICPVSARLLCSGERPAELPGAFSVSLNNESWHFTASEQVLKGYARMRVYRPSAKVLAPYD